MTWMHDHGTDCLLSAVNATKMDTVSTPEYKAALARKLAGRAEPYPSEKMAAMLLGLTMTAMSKPRPVEREEPEAFDEFTGPMSGGER